MSNEKKLPQVNEYLELVKANDIKAASDYIEGFFVEDGVVINEEELNKFEEAVMEQVRKELGNETVDTLEQKDAEQVAKVEAMVESGSDTAVNTDGACVVNTETAVGKVLIEEKSDDTATESTEAASEGEATNESN